MRSKIEWTDETWNPIRARNLATGGLGHFCIHASEGCRHCYSEGFQPRFKNPVRFAAQDRDKVDLFLDEKVLTAPLRWKRPRMVFVCSMTDLFADFVPDEWLDRMFAVMALCPQHTFQVLTKRPDRMREYVMGFTCDGARRFHVARAAGWLLEDGDHAAATVSENTDWPLPNVWLGTSIEDQKNADARVPDLLATPAAVRFVSAEPLLGPVDLRPFGLDVHHHPDNDQVSEAVQSIVRAARKELSGGQMIDWVIVGGESGPKARPMHADWARSLRDQCEQAGVAFFFKQWGAWAPGEIAGEFLDPEEAALGCSYYEDGHWGEIWSEPDGHRDDEPDVYRLGKKRAGRLLDGVTHDGMPQIRETADA